MERSAARLAQCLFAFCVCCLSPLSPGMAQDPFEVARERSSREGTVGDEHSREAPRQQPQEPEHVVRTLEEWRRRLTPEQFLVTRLKHTETAFSGKYAHGHFQGAFLCVCCGAPLFDARHKFESGTGWPSFDRPINQKALESAWDYSEAEARVEVTCRRCGAHLGHVFQDGPTATGMRFCINSLALRLDGEKPFPPASRKASRVKAARSTRNARSAARAPKPAPAATTPPARSESRTGNH